jgi:fumiquinazoline A oxidase
LLENIYFDDSLAPGIATWSEQQRAKVHATSGFKEEHIYVNYAIGDEGAASWYSKKNLRKLRKLKAKWDPRNLFGKGYSLDD